MVLRAGRDQPALSGCSCEPLKERRKKVVKEKVFFNHSTSGADIRTGQYSAKAF